MDKAIDDLLDFAGKVAPDEQPAKQRAASPPANGLVSVSFLTPGGICYETAPMEEMQRNQIGKIVMHLALNLMINPRRQARGAATQVASPESQPT